ncbi:MAG: diguanylate cyclase domain-containing protein [Gammaproteobacteria bacterium]
MVEAHLIELRERLSALQALAAVDQLILAGAGLETVVEALLDRMQPTLRGDVTCIALPSAAVPGAWDLRIDMRQDDAILRRTLSEERGMDPTEPRAGPVPAVLRSLGARTLRVRPVMLESRRVAMLGVGFFDGAPIDASLDEPMDNLGQRLSLAVARHEREERLFRQAHYDPLTGLPNRLLFRERFSGELRRVRDGAPGGALLYLDLDDFKAVNDSLGHEAGDQMLTVIGQRLRACVKESDTVARIGGDEFTVVLRELPDAATARTVARRILDTLSAPIWLAGEGRQVGVSVGIAAFPADGLDCDGLLRRADAAMYRAKQKGRGRIASATGG